MGLQDKIKNVDMDKLQKNLDTALRAKQGISKIIAGSIGAYMLYSRFIDFEVYSVTKEENEAVIVFQAFMTLVIAVFILLVFTAVMGVFDLLSSADHSFAQSKAAIITGLLNSMMGEMVGVLFGATFTIFGVVGIKLMYEKAGELQLTSIIPGCFVLGGLFFAIRALIRIVRVCSSFIRTQNIRGREVFVNEPIDDTFADYPPQNAVNNMPYNDFSRQSRYNDPDVYDPQDLYSQEKSEDHSDWLGS